MNRHAVFIILSLVTAFTTSCRRGSDRYAVEARTAHDIITLLKAFELRQPEQRPTNLLQIFTELKRDYPHDWHKRFRGFGAPGFTNSIFEKYVFLPAGITNTQLHGEILLLNAGPFSDGRAFGRIVIAKSGPVEYRRIWMVESQVQSVLKQLPVPLPSNQTFPVASVYKAHSHQSLFGRLSSGFFDFAAANGISPNTAAPLWRVLLSLPIFFLLLIMFWLWKRSSR